MKNKIQLLCCDLDGTLLNEHHALSEKTIATVQKLQAKGIRMTFCSGRAPAMLDLFLKQLRVDTYLACNGALLMNKKEIIKGQPMATGVVAKLKQYCDARLMDYCLITDRKVYYSEQSERIEKFRKYNLLAEKHQVQPIPLHLIDGQFRLAEHTIYKMLVHELRPSELQEMQVWMEQLNDLSCTNSEAKLLDLGAGGVSKGSGLKALAEYYGLARDQICVFGDWYNDSSMFDYAGFSVAMENACDTLKDQADWITKSNQEDGVAWAIEQLFLG